MAETTSRDREAERAETAVARSASALAVVTALALIVIWLASSSLIASDARRRQDEDWYLRLRIATCSYRAYLDDPVLFYEGLGFAALRDELQLEERLTPCNFRESGAAGLQIWRDLSCLAKRAVAAKGPPADAWAQWPRTVDQCFRDAPSRKILKDPVTFRGFFWARDLEAWPSVAWWLAMNDWPAPDVFGLGAWPRRGVGYGVRLNSGPGSLRERRLYHRLLDSNGKPELVEAILNEASEEIYRAELADSQLELPPVGLPGLSTSLRSDDALIAMGPLVAVSYAIFFLCWRRLDKAKAAAVAPQDTAGGMTLEGFPSFGAPREPFEKAPGDSGLAAWSARMLWFCVLAVPVLTVAAVFVLRGDLRTLLPEATADFAPLNWRFYQLFQMRETDWLSLAIDTFNLAGTWLTAACMLEIVTQGRERRRGFARPLVFFAALVFSALWALQLHRTWPYFSFRGTGFSWSLALFLVFGWIWSWVLLRSVEHRVLTPGIVAVAGLAAAIWVVL